MTRKIGCYIVIMFALAAVCAIPAQQPNFAEKEDELRRMGIQNPSQTADQSQPAVYYRLDFIIREMDGDKQADSRKYSLWVQSGVSERMTAGSQVPYISESYSGTGSGLTKSNQYRSIGVTINSVIQERADSPMLDLQIDISDALPTEKNSDAPIFRKISIASRALLALGKPTTVSIVEDPASRRRFIVDVTAIKLK